MALPAMARALAEQKVQVDVVTTDDDGAGNHVAPVDFGVAIQRDGFRVFFFPKQTEFYKVSLPMFLWLVKHVGSYDVVHVHTVFSFSTLAAGWAAQWARVPFIVRPLGVLNQWGMANRRRWIKGLSFRLLDRPVLNRAIAMHYTSVQEREDAARLKLKPRAEVVPLGIDLEPFAHLPSPALLLEAYPQLADKPRVLFLSRLDRKKNVELLLEAFAQTSTEAYLLIAGSGDPEYVEHLVQRSRELGLAERVLWLGHVAGSFKRSVLAAATLYVLPSETENFGIALLEAMAAGLACIATAGVALAAESAEAVEISPTDAPSLAAAISRLLQDPTERQRLGALAKQRAHDHYSLSGMSHSLVALYESVLRHPHS